MTASPTELLVPLSLLQPSTTNPRKRIDNEALAALAESVAEHEVMQPVLARPHPAPVAGGATLEIVAGERRWRACGLLGERNPHQLPGVEGTVPAIPCLVRDLTDAQVLAMQLVENIARVDRLQWLWKLPMAEAERLCAVLSASQEGDASGNAASPLCQLPEFVLADLRVDARRVAEHAKASVDEILRLAALKHGAPAPAAKKAPAKAKKAATS